MEIDDFETIHLAQELAREKGWDHVMETIRRALREAQGKDALRSSVDVSDLRQPKPSPFYIG